MAKMIVGLGNPERRYLNTRHNIGWISLDTLEKSYTVNWKEKFKGAYADFNDSGEKIILLKPLTYMNLSGESVVPAATFYKVAPEDILVIHDELDLPFGTIAYKKGGGLAGHNGLKSIASLLGTQDFLRLRVGIGRPDHGNVSSYVLSGFDDIERSRLDIYLEGIEASLKEFIKSGFEKAAGKFSKKQIVES